VDGITLWPPTKTGEMSLGADACALYEKNDRPEEGRSWENVVAGARSAIVPRPTPGDAPSMCGGIRLGFNWARDGVVDANGD
jgi:hypothetical protein